MRRYRIFSMIMALWIWLGLLFGWSFSSVQAEDYIVIDDFYYIAQDTQAYINDIDDILKIGNIPHYNMYLNNKVYVYAIRTDQDGVYWALCFSEDVSDGAGEIDADDSALKSVKYGWVNWQCLKKSIDGSPNEAAPTTSEEDETTKNADELKDEEETKTAVDKYSRKFEIGGYYTLKEDADLYSLETDDSGYVSAKSKIGSFSKGDKVYVYEAFADSEGNYWASCYKKDGRGNLLGYVAWNSLSDEEPEQVTTNADSENVQYITSADNNSKDKNEESTNRNSLGVEIAAIIIIAILVIPATIVIVLLFVQRSRKDQYEADNPRPTVIVKYVGEDVPKKKQKKQFCPKCGNKNIEDATFCKKCGRKL